MLVFGHYFLKSGTNFQGVALTPSSPVRSEHPSHFTPLMSFEQYLVEGFLQSSLPSIQIHVIKEQAVASCSGMPVDLQFAPRAFPLGFKQPEALDCPAL